MATSLELPVLFSQPYLPLKVLYSRRTIERVVTSDEDFLNEFSERLNKALDETENFPRKGKGRQIELGKLFGISQRGARKWLEGETMPDTKRLPQIAEIFNLNLQWLLTGKGPMREQPTEPPIKTRPTPPISRRIPIISNVQAGDPRPVIDAYAKGSGIDEWPIDEEMAEALGPYAFALIIEGMSMAPEYLPGDRIIVDPDAPLQPGCIVVAKMDREEQACVKKYRDRGVDESGMPIIELLPLNPDYAPVLINQSNPGHIVGRVVWLQKNLLKRNHWR